MQLFLNQLFNGIENGVGYAAVALALVIVFRTTGLFNFAQGAMAATTTPTALRFGWPAAVPRRGTRLVQPTKQAMKRWRLFIPSATCTLRCCG